VAPVVRALEVDRVPARLEPLVVLPGEVDCQ
jgi:hypothetical protein